MPVAAEISLTTIEWSAVSVALNDAHTCGCATVSDTGAIGPVRRLAGRIFGVRRPNRLADPRLEAIRSYVCASRRRRSPAAEFATPLADHGFTPAQITALGILSR